MTKNQLLAFIAIGLVVMSGCKEKKNSEDIITVREEMPAPSGPVRMQSYNSQREIQWLGKKYLVEISRIADDSLRMVTDESGQQYVDNRVSLIVRRADGSVAIQKKILKSTFESYIDKEYKKAGVLEGLVFDKVDGQHLEFAVSVCLPQTDEYIPLKVMIDNFGNVRIERDSQMDTNGETDDDD